MAVRKMGFYEARGRPEWDVKDEVGPSCCVALDKARAKVAELREIVGCEHEWTRWLERHDDGHSMLYYHEPQLVGEFCERCGRVRMYRPNPENEAHRP